METRFQITWANRINSLYAKSFVTALNDSYAMRLAEAGESVGWKLFRCEGELKRPLGRPRNEGWDLMSVSIANKEEKND